MAKQNLYNRGELRPERRALLEALGIAWSSLRAAWERAFEAARAFRAEHGHLNVPRGHFQNGVNLANWISRQRAGRDKLDDDQIRRLTELGLAWSPFQAAWERAFEAARAFHTEHGHLDVPKGHLQDGINLGEWIAKQRGRRDKLDEDQNRRLTKIGMIWETRVDRAWERGFEAARAFHTEHGHLNVPKGHLHHGVRLDLWVRNIRKQRESLSPERRAGLDKIGMIWDPHGQAWKRALAAACAFHAEHGHLNVPARYVTPDGFRQGAWLMHRRRGNVTSDQRAQLDAIDPSWADHYRPRKPHRKA